MYVKICYEKMPSIWYIIKMFTFDVKHTYLLLSAAVLQSKGYLPFAECCSTAKWSIPTFCWVLQYCKVKHAYHLLSAAVLQSKAYLPSAECCSTAKWSIPIFCWVLQYCKVKHTYLLLSAAVLQSETYLPSAECWSAAKWKWNGLILWQKVFVNPYLELSWNITIFASCRDKNKIRERVSFYD